MEANKGMTTDNQLDQHDDESYKGALFSTLVFVGGTIVLFIIILLVLFIARI